MQLTYRDGQSGSPYTVDIDAGRGLWNMRGRSDDGRSLDLAVALPHPPVTTWLVVAFVPAASLPHTELETFTRQLLGLAKQRGMHLSAPAETVHGDAKAGVPELLQRIAVAFAARGMPLELVLCVMPDRGNASYLYPAIKRWAHTCAGVPSQCVCLSKITDRQKFGVQYIGNLLLKINLKLGGQNQHPAPGGLALMQAAPTIVRTVSPSVAEHRIPTCIPPCPCPCPCPCHVHVHVHAYSLCI